MSVLYNGASGNLLYSSSYGNVFNGTNGGTVMAWINPVNGSPGGTNAVGGAAIGGAGSTSNLSRANLELVGGGIRFTCRSGDGDGGSAVTSTSLAAFSGQWIHVCGTVNWVTRQLSVYVNGALSNSAFAGAMTAGAPTTPSKSGGLGCSGTGGGNNFNGMIEDFRMYGRLLGPDEIKTIYSARGFDVINDAGIIMRLPMQELAPGNAANLRSIAYAPYFNPSNSAGAPIYGTSYTSIRRRRKHPVGVVVDGG